MGFRGSFCLGQNREGIYCIREVGHEGYCLGCDGEKVYEWSEDFYYGCITSLPAMLESRPRPKAKPHKTVGPP